MPVPDLLEVLGAIERGDTDDVLPMLDYLAELLPAGVTTQVLRARACERAGAWNEALAAWQQVRLLVPNSPAAAAGARRALAARRAAPHRPVAGTAPAPVEAPPAEAPPAEVPLHTRFEAPAEPLVATGLEPVEVRLEPAPEAAPLPADAPEAAAIPPPPADFDFDDLDRLIEQLDSARIIPDPNVEAIALDLDDDDAEDMVSETLARIYAAQNQFDEAARVYDQLGRQQPNRAVEFQRKAAEMRARGRS